VVGDLRYELRMFQRPLRDRNDGVSLSRLLFEKASGGFGYELEMFPRPLIGEMRQASISPVSPPIKQSASAGMSKMSVC
jgi:hypothetical protein